MKKLLLVSLCFLLLSFTQVFAQNRTVTGTVTAKDDGLPIPGVTVKVKGTTIATQTNGVGKYTLLSVPNGSTLIFSFIGYATLELPASSADVNAVLKIASNQLGEVVITGALGIKKAEKEVGYATTRISGNSADETQVINPINGLTGKVAGLVIQQTNDGIDPTIKVNLRGSRSVLGNNDALFVLDGVPVSGSVIAALNPADIQDYNVLNGSGAAALYGSEASNGAIVITTKKGSATGKPVITYSNSLQLQQVANLPKIQTSYGQYGGEGQYLSAFGATSDFLNPLTGYPNYVPFENELWGPAFNGQTVDVGYFHPGGTGALLSVPYSSQGNPVKAFFQTGVTEQNDISYAQGDAKNSFNFDIQDAHQKGITPLDASDRISTRLGLTHTYGIFRIDLNTTFTHSSINTNGGTDYIGNNNLYDNILQFPSDLNINASYFKDVNNPNSYGNASNYFSGYSTNPWETIENNRTNITRNIFSGNVLFTLTPTKWLDASYRVSDYFGSYSYKNTVQGVTFAPYTQNDPIATDFFGLTPTGYPNGIAPKTTDITGFGDGTSSIVNTAGPIPNFIPGNGTGMARVQGDALLNFHHDFGDWKTSFLLGNTIWQESMNYTYDYEDRLLIPGFYNQLYNGDTPTLYTANATIRQIAYFGDLNVGYKDWAFLEATLRNDRDSRLAPGSNSFFYPSVKLSVVPTDFVPGLKSNTLDYLKIWADESRVGQVSLPPYSIQQTYLPASGFPFTSLGGLNPSGTYYPPGLKPEQTTEFEVGTELGFFQDRLNFKVDYYNQVDRNQTLSISTTPSTGYTKQVVNAGAVRSQGYEFTLNAIVFPKTADGVGWNVGGNFSINNNTLLSLTGNVKQETLATDGDEEVVGVVGKSFPQLFATDYYRDPQGHIIVNPNTGTGTVNASPQDMGGTQPKYNLGLNTALSYKFVTLSIVAEYRGGDVIYNALGPEMTFAGSDAFSSQAGRQIFIIPNSVLQTGSGTYVKNTTVPVSSGGINYWVQGANAPENVGSTYVSSAAFWKIREISLDFNLNQFINKTGFMKGLTVGLDARNVFTFLPKSEMWGDPEEQDVVNNGNGYGISDSSILPSSRYYGAKLQVTF